MELFRTQTNFKFMKYRFLWMGVSALLIVGSLMLWFQSGESKFGVEFVGGTEIVVRFEKPIDIGAVRQAVLVPVPDATIQSFGQHSVGEGPFDFAIKGKGIDQEGVGGKVREALSKISDNPFSVLKEDSIGPTIGAEIRNDGILAFVLSLVGILIYVTVRFEWSFACGAVIALLHDGIITTGAYLLDGREVNAALLAAVLTIVGYSVNDTIIVYDRIRENLSKALKAKGSKGKVSLTQLIDDSINQTLSRTLITSSTVLLVSLALWQLGGGAVSDLAFAMFVGVMIGTYSSIFVASPTMALLSRTK